MKKNQLSPRLNSVYSRINKKHPIWDICCDHGYLGIECILSTEAKDVNFCDPGEDLMNNLANKISANSKILIEERWFKSYELNNKKVKLYCCKAEKLDVNSVKGTVVIMGVGTKTITSILNSWLENAEFDNKKIQDLILGTHTQIQVLEEYVQTLPWELSERWSVLEKNKERQFFKLSSI